MDMESKYTSLASKAGPLKVHQVLTPKVIAMPSATGKSMLIRRSLRSVHALLQNGPQANDKTGKAKTQLAHRKSICMSGVMSSGLAK
jgi:hypothetical protein